MLLKPKYMDTVKDIVFSIVCKMYFPMALSKRSTPKDNKYAKKGITSSMKCVDVATFTFRYVTDKILFTMQVYFAGSWSF